MLTEVFVRIHRESARTVRYLAFDLGGVSDAVISQARFFVELQHIDTAVPRAVDKFQIPFLVVENRRIYRVDHIREFAFVAHAVTLGHLVRTAHLPEIGI